MITHKRLFTYGMLAALIALGLDQLHKWYMLEVVNIDAIPPIVAAPFLDIVMVWNYGVSFGLFSNHDGAQAWLLVGLTSGIVLILLWWLAKADHWCSAFGAGLVIGGAVGNIIDRIRFKAVADFFYFHIGGFYWPAFNIADSAIFIGVVLLLCHSIFIAKSA